MSDSPSVIAQAVLEQSGLLTELSESKDPQDEVRVENLEELVAVATEYEEGEVDEGEEISLVGFLEDVSLVADADQIPEGEDHGGVVTMMTLHTAKGLEFPTVFLTGMEDGIFPHSRTLGEKDEIEEEAIRNNTSVLAVGNFALTVVLLQKFSEIAAKYIPNFEIIDYAHETKMDSPSGTARELAKRLSHVQESTLFVTAENLIGLKETRGARLNGVQVHSVRLPGHVISIESIFGLKDEKLTLRHDSGSSAEPYVQGGILAIQKVGSFIGLKRGLDSVMEF